MWTLIWGLDVNRVLNTWNRESCASLDEALESAAGKLNSGFVAYAILSPTEEIQLDEDGIKTTLRGGSAA